MRRRVATPAKEPHTPASVGNSSTFGGGFHPRASKKITHTILNNFNV
ncbi:hypothetical protein HMPREF9997_02145 [Corynebacterium durum F0235]|uniref:Uncharacterized protein n=1 Tax=Corynebacterium durum F0235 TaxID=1035195 RepID=L1MD72_9CORY|nr:hypothetical protein HMPREF9997_02145 [Corynebacterium durum F0235]